MAKIMVVDDRAVNRSYLESLLTSLGHDVCLAEDGLKALDTVQTEIPALVITDIDMPRMDGVEFVTRMRTNPQLRHVPVIFHSATYRVPDARRLAHSCKAEIIPKPCEPEVVMAAVGAALNSAAVPAPPARGEPHVLNKMLVSLVDFQCAVNDEEDPQAVLGLLSRAAPKLIGARGAVVGMEEGHTARLVHVATFAIRSEETFAVNSSVSAEFARRLSQGHLRRTWNASGEPLNLGLPALHRPVRGLLAVPLAAHNAVHGWIYLIDRADGMPFTESDEELLTVMARQAATAYENDLLHRRATRDGLTGLMNRREFDTAFAREHARSLRLNGALSLIIVDADHFKRINDTFGHAAGDAVLCALANVLQENVRGYDQVFRIGGEEFGILMPGASADDAKVRAEQIREQVRCLALRHDDVDIGPVTVSLGVSANDGRARTKDEMFSASDRALYDAKRSGRNRTCVAAQSMTAA